MTLAPAAPASHPAAVLSVDHDQRLALVDGRPLDLTFQEFELLAYLASRPLQAHSRESLLSAVWGWGNGVTSRTVDTHVARLRTKLGPRRGLLETVHRVGYR